MTPDERAFAAERLRELATQTRGQLARLNGHTADRELFVNTAGSVAVLAEVLAVVVEGDSEAADR
jgi:hypothetical protein